MGDISIDLETLDVVPTAHILAIGAAKFDIETGEIIDKFYRVMPMTPQLGRSISPDTVGWWMKQSEEARNAITNGVWIDLLVSLNSLRTFVGSDNNVWGNGATFDISILENAYSFDIPWNFYQVRDMRTIVALAEEISNAFDKHTVPFEGEKHNAIADAIHQAKVISASYKALI